MEAEALRQYVHPNWDELPQCRGEKYYFVQLNPSGLEQTFAEIQDQLSVEIPEDLKKFYRELGFGFLWFHLKQKKGLYRILSPEELLDLYFEPEDDSAPDDFITYRENAWNNLEEHQLLAFCLFGEEDSLLYVGLSDGAVYYLSARYQIANSIGEFLALLDEKVDYFMDK